MAFSSWKKIRNRATRNSKDHKLSRLLFRRRRKLHLERLEDRLAPATLSYTIPNGGPHAITPLQNGTDLEIFESSNHAKVLAGPQATASTTQMNGNAGNSK